MFVEIAATEESGSLLGPRQVHDPPQGVSQRLTTPASGVTRRAGPCECGVEVEIRKVNELHYRRNLWHRADERQGALPTAMERSASEYELLP